MKKALTLFTIVALATAGIAKDEEANKKDMEKMQGDWAAVSMVRDGMPFPKDDAQSFFRTVKGDKYTVFHFSEAVNQGTFTIDASKKPKTMDVLPERTDDKSKAILGIYEFEGDKLKVCFGAPGKDRPAEFESKEGSGNALTVWEREKKK
jgi:uncharacterized protein (TIGR03067 family)